MTASPNHAEISAPENEEPESPEAAAAVERSESAEAVDTPAPVEGAVEAEKTPDVASDAAFGGDELPPEELHAQALRVVEALIFASAEALTVREISKRLPKSVDVKAILAELEAHYAPRGVTLVRIAGKVAFRTAADIADRLKIERVQTRKLSRAALETLAIIAYQTAEDRPVTRSEIEEIRGVALSKGTLEVLMEAEFVGPKGNRETPGRPVTYAVTDRFLEHFGLDGIKSLPGLKELRDLGLLDTRPAVSAYSEDSGLSVLPEMGDAAEAETGPIDDREMEAQDAQADESEVAEAEDVAAEAPPSSERP